MKSIKEFIIESIDKKPKIGETAYDWNDMEWEIQDWCTVGDKDKLKDLLDSYDESGAMGNEIEDMGLEKDEIIVGAENEDGDNAAFLWGPSGLYYKE